VVELSIAAVIGTITAVQWLLDQERRERAAIWREVGEQLGLRFRGGLLEQNWLLEGEVAGHGLRVRPVYRIGPTQQRSLVTIFDLRFHTPLPFWMSIRSSSLDAGRGRNVSQGVTLAEGGARVETRHPAALAQWLTPVRRRRLGHFLRHMPEAVVNDRGLSWAAPGIASSRKPMVKDIRAAASLANVLVLAPPATEAAAEAAAEPAAEPPRRSKKRRKRKAAAQPTRSRSVSPAAAAPTPVPAPAQAPPQAGALIRDPVSVADDLFGRRLEDIDASERFEAAYADRPVAWAGILRRLERVTVDFVFGDGPFTRATVELKHEDAGPMGARALLAVVRLPVEDGERLRERVGGQVAFTGLLHAIDPFSRSLFVAQGAVDDALVDGPKRRR